MIGRVCWAGLREGFVLIIPIVSCALRVSALRSHVKLPSCRTCLVPFRRPPCCAQTPTCHACS
jgi:hypothetical protein